MASPRRKALRIPDGPGVADGEANEKYVEYMKAVRLVQQRARVEAKTKAKADAIQGDATSSPAPSKAAGIGQTSASAAKVSRTPTPGGVSTPLKSSGGRGPAVRGSSASLPVSGRQARRVPQGSLAARPDSPGSDSSDSIDFEVRSIGHVRSVKNPGSAADTPSRPVSDSVTREIRDLQSVLQKSLAGAQGGLTHSRGKMGKDDGVELEADVGFKDGKKEVFSPHGLSDRQDSNRSSHVDEDAQAKTASKKIAELEELAKEVRTPGGKGTDRSKSFLSASDQLKASLSAYRSGVAVSSGDTERAPDTGDVRERVRNQLSQMHNSTAKNDDDDDDDDDADERDALQTPTKSESGESGWSSNRQQLQAKLRSYQAQVKILTGGKKKQDNARRPDNDSDDNGMEANGQLYPHTGAGKAVLEVGDGPISKEDRYQKLQQDNQKVLDNIKQLESKRAEGSIGGSAGPLQGGSAAPLQSRISNKADSSPYGGVFPQSDDLDEAPIGGGTMRSKAKTGEPPKPIKPITSDAQHDENGFIDEEDAVMIVEENLRLAFSYATYFAFFTMFIAVCSFIFGIFMPWGFSVWAIAVPFGLASFFFYWKCTPLPVTSDSTVPQSLVWFSLAVFSAGAFFFFAGILSASASLSIAPILGTPLCTSDPIPPPVDLFARPCVSQFASQLPTQEQACRGISDSALCTSLGCTLSPQECVALDTRIGCCRWDNGCFPRTNPTELCNDDNKRNSTGTMRQGTTPAPNSPSTIPKAIRNTPAPNSPSTNPEVHELSGLDPDTLMKFGACQGWNMCGGLRQTPDNGSVGIKMLTCSQLKGLNDWNAVFFLFSAFLIPPLWMWIYYVITIRLQEHMLAATKAPVDVLDCSLPACYIRFKEMLQAPYPGTEREWDEEGNDPTDTRPKFTADGPYSYSGEAKLDAGGVKSG